MENPIWPELTPIERVERLNFMIERNLEGFVDKHNVRDIYDDLKDFRFICLSLALMKCSMAVYTSCCEDIEEETKTRFRDEWEVVQENLRNKLPSSLADEVLGFAKHYGSIVVRLFAQLWDELREMDKAEQDLHFNILNLYVRGYGELEKQICLNFRETFCTLMQKFCNEFRD